MAKRILDVGRINTAKEIDVEGVLPWTSAQRARLDFRQTQVAQSKRAQSPEQSARNVPGSEDKCRLPHGGLRRVNGMPARILGFAQEEESREIAAIAFDGAAQDAAAVDLGRDGGGDSGCVGKALLDNHLHAAGGVIERNALNL